jgi:3-oxoacyl-(acyl-carrier-protein) synthase
MTAPPEDGRGAALAMSNAIDDAEINLSELIILMRMEHQHRLVILQRPLL